MTEEKLRFYLKNIERNNKKGKKINAILHLNENAEKEAKIIDEKIKKGEAGKLAGKIISVKSNIHVKGMICNCASRTLENYKAPYDATVIKKLKEEDGLIIGMCNMDEFACGSSGETSAFGVCKNPTALDLIPGGSSSGSAASVAADFCDISLGSDTGGSVRNPASHCGVIGVKPTYGLVSRYGLIDLSMSLDQISPITKNIEDAILILNVIKGKDEKDPITYESEEIKFIELNKIKIAFLEMKCDERIYNFVLNKVMNICEKENFIFNKIKPTYIDLAVQTYYPICYVEFFSATRKFDGRRFGKRIEDSCGKEVLRRILGGQEICQAEYKGKYYRQALKVKQLIKKEFDKIFINYDAIVLPTVPKLPHKIGTKLSVEEMYSYDSFTIPANLAEIPSISIPIGKINNIPIGLQIMCKRFDESKMFSIANKFIE
ncbi:MAG: Asp-tRNA(Asn)/Glu-tRNA(Gln) amidotransferase subunit GatA [Candidatus Pacearchaeota archaeon]